MCGLDSGKMTAKKTVDVHSITKTERSIAMNSSLETRTEKLNHFEHMTMMGIYPACSSHRNLQKSVFVITTENAKKSESKSGEEHTESINKRDALIPRIKNAQKLMMTAFRIANRRKEEYQRLLKEYRQKDFNLALVDGRLKIVKPKSKPKKKELKLSDLTQQQIEELKRSLGIG